MKMNITHFVCILAILLISLSFAADAQPVPDNRGTDFWLAFPPNYHNSTNSPFQSLRNGDTISIFVAGESAASGNIQYRDKLGKVRNQKFDLVAPDYFYEFKTNYNNYEIIGINDGGDYDGPDNSSDAISPMYFEVTTDKDVSVYANSQAWYTSDAWMAMPTDALGTQYMIMSYYTDADGDFSSGNSQSTPSQFIIIAPEDSTIVQINPTAPTYKHSAPYSVTLNKGDVYLVQNKMSNGHFHDDLTGTVVNSSKPVAIISGHQRSAIPISTGISRDVLIEQLQPLNSWGFNAIITPFIQDPTSDNPFDKDLCRILAAYDSTEIYIGATDKIILNKGKFFEFDLTDPLKIEANKRIQVAVFKKSGSNGSSTTGETLSDPFMVILPQVEQYNKSYTFVNVQTMELLRDAGGTQPIGGSRPSYKDHYVTIIAHDSVINGISLDGQMVSGFLKVPNSDYNYVNKSVTEGIHHINATGPFSATVYGYGYANSYGYLAGMNYVDIKDTIPPAINMVRNCFDLQGSATDTVGFDSGITRVTLDSMINCSGSVEPFTGNVSTVSYNLSLLNQYLDGSAYLVALDSIGLKTRRHIDIPGFTIAPATSTDSKNPAIYETWIDTLPGYKLFCRNLTLVNYGKFPQNLNNFFLASGKGILDFSLTNDTIIPPGKRYTVTICKPISGDTAVVDTVYIKSDCGMRPVLALDLRFLPDESTPRLDDTVNSCAHTIILTIKDNYKFDSGLDSIKIDSVYNMNYIVNFDTLVSYVNCSVVNPFMDAYIRIIAKDRFGLETVYEKGIAGYTLSWGVIDSLEYNGTDSVPSSSTKKYTFDTTTIGTRNCDTIEVYNYGSYDYILDEGFFASNITFSLPLSQFPITVPPKSYADLIVCYAPFHTGKEMDRDSLVIWGNCVPKLLPFEGAAQGIVVNGDSKCDLPLVFTADSASRNANFIEQAPPAPSLQSLNLRVSLAQNDYITVTLYDISGNAINLVENMAMSKGSYDLNIDAAKISAGLYFGVLKYGSGAVSTKILVGK